MTTYMRHGDANHVIRPDRVTRTGVVPPLVGFAPVQDVMQNAREFTMGPYMWTQDSTNPASARGIAGLGLGVALLGTPTLMGPGVGPFKRMWLRYKANRAAKQYAKKMLSGVAPSGPAAAMGPQVVPSNAGRVAALSMIAAQNFPASWDPDVLGTIVRRWNGRNPRNG